MGPLPNLGAQLTKIRAAAAEREAEQRAASLGLPYFNVASAPVKTEALKLIPEARARKLQVAVFELQKPILGLAVLNPEAPGITELLAEFKKDGYAPKLFITSLRGLEHLWSFYTFVAREKPPITSRVNIERDQILKLMAELDGIPAVAKAVNAFDPTKQSVTEFLEIILSGALANRASDIHFEPEERAVKLRFRIDGLLSDVAENLSRAFYPSVISRIKLLSNLKINISDQSQDGRFTIGLSGKDVEIRVAIAPSEFGEIIVMRVLDPAAISISLSDLGLRADDLALAREALKRPHGMIVNTGPTGSGKTTTLYAFLKAAENPEIKIITIEDPIEYHVSGIEQTQVDEEAGYTFADGLKSIMRQDPDMILVGEVRDKDTAEIAIQAALTGHLVFSTIHANEAAGAIPRFLDLGVKHSSLSPALNLIIAQRLVRRLCSACRKPMKVSRSLAAHLKTFLEKLPARVERAPYSTLTLYEPVGCPRCHAGYHGRIALFELLVNDHNKLEALIGKESGERAFQEYATSSGMVTMQEDGILKVVSGITTFAEVEAVTGPLPKLIDLGA